MFCFLLLGCLNVLLALLLSVSTARYEFDLNDALKGEALPLLTKWVIQYSWWTWVGVTICVIGAILSLCGKLKGNMRWNLLIVILIVDLVVMFLTVVAFTIPCYRL